MNIRARSHAKRDDGDSVLFVVQRKSKFILHKCDKSSLWQFISFGLCVAHTIDAREFSIFAVRETSWRRLVKRDRFDIIRSQFGCLIESLLCYRRSVANAIFQICICWYVPGRDIYFPSSVQCFFVHASRRFSSVWTQNQHQLIRNVNLAIAAEETICTHYAVIWQWFKISASKTSDDLYYNGCFLNKNSMRYVSWVE